MLGFAPLAALPLGAVPAAAGAGGEDLVRVLSEGLAATEALLRSLARIRLRGVGVALTHTTARSRTLTRIDAEALGIVEDSRFARALTRIRSHAAGIAESVSEVVGALGDALVRVLFDTVGLAEARNRFLSRTRARGETVGIGHATLRTRAISRLHGEAVAIAEAVARLGGLVAAVVPAIVRNRRRTATRPATRLEAPPSPRMANRPARRT